MLSTEFVYVEVDVRSLYPRVLPMVNPNVKVSTKSSFREEPVPKLRREQDDWLVHFEC